MPRGLKQSPAIYLTDGLYERCYKEAEAREVKVTWLIDRLVKEGLERIVPAEEFRLTRKPEEAS